MPEDVTIKSVQLEMFFREILSIDTASVTLELRDKVSLEVFNTPFENGRPVHSGCNLLPNWPPNVHQHPTRTYPNIIVRALGSLAPVDNRLPHPATRSLEEKFKTAGALAGQN